MSAESIPTPTATSRPVRVGKRQMRTSLFDDHGNVFRCKLNEQKNGKFVVYAVNTVTLEDGKEQRQTGASEVRDSFEEAKAAFDELIASAAAQGWRLPRLGGSRQRDEFTLASLPKPKLAVKEQTH